MKDDMSKMGKQGIIAKAFDPSEGGSRKFKHGMKKDSSDPLCKGRYQQVSVTNMMDVVNDTTRIL